MELYVKLLYNFIVSQKKCMNVAIIGAPNVGKSSLLNCWLGEKNSIVSPRPHTTRNNVLGILNENDVQLVFVDTPGFAKSKFLLNCDLPVTKSSEHFDNYAIQIQKALQNIDYVVLVVDAIRVNAEGTANLLSMLLSSYQNKFCVILNKIDRVKKGQLYKIIDDLAAEANTKVNFNQVIYCVSALMKKGTNDVIKFLQSVAQKKEWQYTNELPVKREIYGAECVREKAFYVLKQEVPFFLKTRAMKWNFDAKKWNLTVNIEVPRLGHKKIVIGKNAATVKTIGSAARSELMSKWGAGSLFVNVEVVN